MCAMSFRMPVLVGAALALVGSAALANGCRLSAGGRDSMLSSVGGAFDAVLFSGYHTRFLPNGLLVVHDPIASQLLVFGRDAQGRLLCSRPVGRIRVSRPTISAIAVHGDAIYGIDIEGRVRQLYPSRGEARRGENLGPPASTSDTQQVLLSSLASSHPLFEARGVWPGAAASADVIRHTGEIGLSPSDNRLVSVPSGAVLIGGAEYRHAVEWSSSNAGSLRIWAKQPGPPDIVLPIVVPGILGAVDILRTSATGHSISAESVDLDASGAVRVVDHVLTYSADGMLLQRKAVVVPAASTRGNWSPMDSPAEADPLTPNRLFYFYRDNTALVSVAVDLNKVPSASSVPSVAAPTFAVPDPSRAELIRRADAFLEARWIATPSSLNEGNEGWACTAPFAKNSQRWAQPIFLRDIRPGSHVYGIPYLWGGKAGLSDFLNRVKAGSIAGNVCTRVVDGRTVTVPDSAGIDCSGFVSRVWELGDGKRRVDLSTVAIATNKFSKPLGALQQLQAGDVLNKPGSHVRLFAAWVRTPFGLRIRSYESTVDSICSGTCVRDLRARAYVGYTPRGYLN